MKQDVYDYFSKNLQLPEDFSLSDPLCDVLKGEGSTFQFGIVLMNFFELHNIPIKYDQKQELSFFPNLESIINYIKKC